MNRYRTSFLSELTLLKRFPENRYGRDFIVGDLHGMLALLKIELKKVQFDTQKDRLFSVGDLIDRGPSSYDCTQLLQLPWFYAVLGNHEWMALTAADDPATWSTWQQNGGEWWTKRTDEDQQRVLKTLKSLPLVIEVEHSKGTIGIVHADVPCDDWNRVQHLTEEERLNAIWSRKRLYERDHTSIRHVRWVVHGHSIVDQPTRLGNRLYIDTGAYMSDHLTVISLDQLFERR